MDLGLRGKVALITGASKGIGLATALQLAKEGAKIAICARNSDALAEASRKIYEETGVQALELIGDVTMEENCKMIVHQTAEHFGRLDILINNAGTHAAHPFEKVESSQWNDDLNLKLFAAIHCSRYAIPYMRKNGGGSIVNLSATLAHTPPPSSLPTTVSRAAGMALTKAMSKDLGPDNIRVNAVCIGVIRSDQIEKIHQKEAPHLTFEQFSKQFSNDPRHSIPLGRIGDSEEAAKAITFLVSDAASYITGTAINVDGGMAGVL